MQTNRWYLGKCGSKFIDRLATIPQFETFPNNKPQMSPKALPATLGKCSILQPCSLWNCSVSLCDLAMQWKALHQGRAGGLPQKALSALHCLIQWGKVASRPHKEKGGGRSSVVKENLGPRLSSNMWNINIACCFITGKPNPQEEAGLDVSTVFVRQKSWKRWTRFFFQYLSKEIVGYCKQCSIRKPSTLTH